MKSTVPCLTILLLAACSQKTDVLLGEWKVISTYYKGTYEIIEENDSIKGRVLYYNDDTTIIQKKEGGNFYVFENLKASEDHFIDAISGATITKNTTPNISLYPIHKDTLEVVTHIRQKPLKELWVRVDH